MTIMVVTVTLPVVFDFCERVEVFAQTAFCSEQVCAVVVCFW